MPSLSFNTVRGLSAQTPFHCLSFSAFRWRCLAIRVASYFAMNIVCPRRFVYADAGRTNSWYCSGNKKVVELYGSADVIRNNFKNAYIVGAVAAVVGHF